jgi:hypothetical protein
MTRSISTRKALTRAELRYAESYVFSPRQSAIIVCGYSAKCAFAQCFNVIYHRRSSATASSHELPFPQVRVVRDEQAMGSNPATPTRNGLASIFSRWLWNQPVVRVPFGPGRFGRMRRSPWRWRSSSHRCGRAFVGRVAQDFAQLGSTNSGSPNEAGLSLFQRELA